MKKNRQYISSILVLLFLYYSVTVLAGPQAEPKVIRVGCIDLENFIEKKENGMIKGYGAEYLDEIAKYTGWRYEYVSGTWGQCLEWLKEGNIDLLLPAEDSEERRRDYIFSKYSCCIDYAALYSSKENDSLFYEDFASFDGMKVGMIRQNHLNANFQSFAEERYFHPELVYYDSLAELSRALTEGKVDAIVNGSLSTAPNQKLLAKFDFMPAYFMMAKHNTALMEELDRAMYEILLENPYFTAMLNEKFYQNSNLQMKGLTREETAYVQNSPPLVVVCDPNNYPFEWYNEKSGKYEGVYSDILNAISKHSGLRFEFVRTQTLEESWQMIKAGKADLISGIYGNPLVSRDYHITYTLPHLEEANTLIGNRNIVSFNQDTDLSIAIQSGFVGTQYYLHEYYPKWNVVTYPTVEECLKAVNDHAVDLTLMSSAALQMSSLPNRYPNLGVISTISVKVPISIGIADRHAPLLKSILNKTILRVDKGEIQKSILQNTFIAPREVTFHYLLHNYLPEVSALVLFVILSLSMGVVFLYRERVKTRQNILLANNNADLKQSVMLAKHINETRDLYDALYDTAMCGIIQYAVNKATQEIKLLHANKGACVMLGVYAEDGGYHFPVDAKAGMEKIRMDAALLEQPGDKNSFECEVSQDSGQFLWISGTCELLMDSDGEKIIQSTFMDLTNRKRAEEQLRYYSEIDSLTGLFNKRTAEKLCQDYLLENGGQHSAALFVMDIDNFKAANDSYGHQYGDEVLSTFGALLQSIFRKEDIIGRIGGDEFVVMMKNVPNRAMLEVKAGEICSRTKRIATEGHMPMACSVGIALQKEGEVAYDALFARADHALYEVKLAGKNRWHIADEA